MIWHDGTDEGKRLALLSELGYYERVLGPDSHTVREILDELKMLMGDDRNQPQPKEMTA